MAVDSATTAETMADFTGSCSMPRTKLGSIFTTSMGKRAREPSEEWPVPKSSMATRTPRVCSVVRMLRRQVDVVHGQALGHLEAELPRVEPGRLQDAGHLVDQVGLLELAGRHVHPDLERDPEFLLPDLRLAAGLLEHHARRWGRWCRCPPPP